MPTRTYFREFCSTCKAFTLHNTTAKEIDGISGLPCRECGKVELYCKYWLATPEQIAEQQQRYRDSRAKIFWGVTNLMTGFDPNYENVSIQETDAGYKAQEQKKMDEKKALRAAQLKELVQFNGLGRNYACLCGSGKKYKKCCLAKHKTFEDYGNVHLIDKVEVLYASEPVPTAEKEKGALNGICNLSSCTSGKPATYYNHGSMAHYCKSCALRLNRDEHNYKWAHEKFGHDLCTPANEQNDEEE